MAKTDLQKARETACDTLLGIISTNFNAEQIIEKAKNAENEEDIGEGADLYAKLNYLEKQIKSLKDKVNKPTKAGFEKFDLKSIRGVQLVEVSESKIFDKDKAIKKLEELGENPEDFEKKKNGYVYLKEDKQDETIKNT